MTTREQWANARPSPPGSHRDKQQQQRLYRYPGPGGWYAGSTTIGGFVFAAQICLWSRFHFSFATASISFHQREEMGKASVADRPLLWPNVGLCDLLLWLLHGSPIKWGRQWWTLYRLERWTPSLWLLAVTYDVSLISSSLISGGCPGGFAWGPTGCQLQHSWYIHHLTRFYIDFIEFRWWSGECWWRWRWWECVLVGRPYLLPITQPRLFPSDGTHHTAKNNTVVNSACIALDKNCTG